ncbi:uncharacterized protein [Clytia hemisphaerica]|uniref:Transmembrane protein n=1 Tax=Clytia hemisphaerica TaxID=252671 RepID=A0A7M5WS88_9CNID|eukprot:TCONS_00070645-protein
MCLSGEIPDNWPPLIELIIFLAFGGLDVFAHYNIWVISKTKIIDITGNMIFNVSLPNDTSSNFYPPITTAPSTNLTDNSTISGSTSISLFMNVTKTPDELWADLIEFRQFYFYVWLIGLVLFAVQTAWLIPNVIKHIISADPAVLKDPSAHCYFRSVFSVHVLFLLLGTFIFDIPISCLAMEMLSLIWKGEALTTDEKLVASKDMVMYSLLGLSLIALYKGMMPLFLWIGNPFCFPCIPLRLLIVMPGGLVVMVMTFTPPMGVAKNGLLTFAPPEMQAQLGELAGTFFQIGLIIWGLFFIVVFLITCCYCKFCREESKDGNTCLCC